MAEYGVERKSEGIAAVRVAGRGIGIV